MGLVNWTGQWIRSTKLNELVGLDLIGFGS